MPITNISHIVLILSGKGGVGKSSTTLQLALALSLLGRNVGILDIDLTGPSIPRLLGLEDRKITQAPGGWVPVEVHPSTSSNSSSSSTSTCPHSPLEENGESCNRGSLHAISLGFLLSSRSSAVIWRGPKKTAMIRQFLSDVQWPDLDYLLIDTPPGTSDEHIAVLEELHKLAEKRPGQLAGAVVVTTPQAISTSDVRKELNFCVKTETRVLGVIENMAGYMCPCCGEVSNVFSKGGGEVMARENGVPFIGSVPIDTGFGGLVDGVRYDEKGAATDERDDRALVERYMNCKLRGTFAGFARQIIQDVQAQKARISETI
jgi:Mrp family chromosome partitioning ATPase